MIRHIFLKKTNTIIKGIKNNLGLNPILKLNYGKNISRGLINFDFSEIKAMVENDDLNLSKSIFTLKMVNCMSIDSFPYEKSLYSNVKGESKRACSFDLILFKLPQEFDAGRGYDYESDFWIKNKESISTEASNWYFSKNGLVWEVDKDKVDLNDSNLNWNTVIKDKNLEGGIYSSSFLSNQYSLFKDGKDSIVVGSQHFDFGNENLSIDITPYIKDVLLKKEPNYGLCLAFAPSFETMEDNINHYVGFFTDNTNTFFHPYVEINNNDIIYDNRYNFLKNQTNRLYFYVNNNGISYNLDNIPTCTINEKEYKVQHAQKGVYFAEISDFSDDVEDNTIFYDTWGNLSLNGHKLRDVEMEFVVKPIEDAFTIGKLSFNVETPVPTIIGVNDSEIIKHGEVRKILVDFRKKFTTNEKIFPSSCEYRLYVKDGNIDREYEIIPYTKIDKIGQYFQILIFAKDLIPNRYYIDIKAKNTMGEYFFKETLNFIISNNVTNRYE